MKMHPLDSSNLEAVGYDPETNTLVIEFKRSGVYNYHDVPSQIFEEILAADSPGTYHNLYIKNVYGFSK